MNIWNRAFKAIFILHVVFFLTRNMVSPASICGRDSSFFPWFSLFQNMGLNVAPPPPPIPQQKGGQMGGGMGLMLCKLLYLKIVLQIFCQQCTKRKFLTISLGGSCWNTKFENVQLNSPKNYPEDINKSKWLI